MKVKILKLTMSAFMAYRDKTVIDFQELSEQGIYLISGPTGAGKTTLFDAMTFALYGVASGSHRQAAYFRSDFADAKDETYVEMTFELHNRIYTIKRSPTYIRQGYKTPKMAQAFLQDGDVLIEGVKEVNMKVKELLGVDDRQFKQIVMIAQGEFTKLIYASSEEREKVLRHVFHSESLVIFENLLKEETKKYKEQYQLSLQELSSRFQMLHFDTHFMDEHAVFQRQFIEEAMQENEKCFQQKEAMQKHYQDQKNLYDKLYQEYYLQEKRNQELTDYLHVKEHYEQLLLQEDAMKELKTALDKMKKIEENQSMIDQYHQIHEQLEKSRQTKQDIEKQIVRSQTQMNAIQKDYDQLEDKKQQKDQQLLEIEKLKQALEKCADHQKLSLHKQQQEEQYQLLKEQFQSQQAQYTKLENRMQRDTDSVNQLPRLQLELEQDEKTVMEINQKRIAIHELSQFYDEWKALVDQHYELSVTYQQHHQDYEKILTQYRHEDEKFRRHQAGILAINLKDNEPCPVCGSLHHPHLAQLSQQVLSSYELEELAHNVEKAKTLQDESYQEVLSQKEKVSQMFARIEVLKKQLNIQEDLSKEVFIHLLSDIVQVIGQQEQTYQKKQNQVEYLKKLLHSLKQDQKRAEQQAQHLEQLREHMMEVEKLILADDTRLQQLEKDYQWQDEKHLKEQLENAQILLEQLQKHIHDTETTYQRCRQELVAYGHQKELLCQQFEEIQERFQQCQADYEAFLQRYAFSKEDIRHFFIQKDYWHQQEASYTAYQIEKKTLQVQMEQGYQRTKGYQMVSLTKQKQHLTEMEKQRDDALKQYNEQLHIYEQNAKIIQQLKTDNQKNQKFFEKYTLYQDLYDMASGKNPQRMSFERYVLSAYFEHILEFANIELLKMSQGRFALYRKEDVKGSKQQGLELSVLDYETGLLRDIQSLSGGESFKAALSLALGLSTMIQNYAGGIELNTLFIDEGFGSLDHESIDQALSVLMELQNDHKVIGIISHVDELKERIATQLIVEKGKQGSSLYIVKE